MYVWPFQDIKLAAISFQNCNFSTYDLDTLNTRIPAFYFVLFSNYVINNITVNYLIIFPFHYFCQNAYIKPTGVQLKLVKFNFWNLCTLPLKENKAQTHT